MDKDFILRIAQTAREQLLAGTPMQVVMSWGVTDFAAMEFKGMAALRFHVNGRLFKGYVVIAYNASDYYEVYLLNRDGVTCVHNEVYCDELGTTIDEAVESGTDKEEYDRFCKAQLDLLIAEQGWHAAGGHCCRCAGVLDIGTPTPTMLAFILTIATPMWHHDLL